MVAARLDADLVARVDALVAGGAAASRTEVIDRALRVWTRAAEEDRWAAVVDDGCVSDEGFSPMWDDDDADWDSVYADVLEPR
jgi:Arc/MetJ-type ribon-helix-helix transcriptional regulator